MERDGHSHAVACAAATLVLLEGAQADVSTALREWAGPAAASRWDASLRSGSRDQRARALAAPLRGLALALQDWGVR